MSEVLKLSPLDQEHRELGGCMVPLAGWEMPSMYSSIFEEHQAVRDACGVFDISHMGQIFAEGNGATAWLNKMLTNDVATLDVGNAHYLSLIHI